MLHSGEEK
jgi:hypothetical protein